MGKNSNYQDDESERVPPGEDGEDIQRQDQTESAKDDEATGFISGEDHGMGENGSEDDPEATVADIEPMDLQEDGDQGGDRGTVDIGTVDDVTEVESSSASSELGDDLDATVVDIDPSIDLNADGNDDNGTVAEIEATPKLEDGNSSAGQENQGDAEVDLDATVNELEATFLVEDGPGSDSDADSGSGDDSSDEIEKTVIEGGIDQTVMAEPEDEPSDGDGAGKSGSRSVVRSGGAGKGKKFESTIRDAQEATYDGYDSHPSVQTIDSNVLESGNIGQTINPRELSDEEASAWSLAAQGEVPKNAKTVQSGGGPRRTWVDYQFSRLRERSVGNSDDKKTHDADYRLVRKLGQGGMGDVYVARQGSLNRLLALKLIKPIDAERRAKLKRLGKLKRVEEERKQQFLSEAIVTGDLDHPNIVPIHDVAVTSDNEIFYSMKRVVGTPWSDVIAKTSRAENLDILMKSCDAIGFAHERGVVHRDIKPENIMLGDFGVVMVMDWGLALPTTNYDKHDSIFATSGLGGTPAFMAPEMATGPLEIIGPASDIYLLGATLFMIVTGSAPHKADSVTECLQSVRRNTIREVSEAQRGELLDIAMRAMATKPEDRYPDVASFQNDIRAYRDHAESISLTVRATEDMELGQREGTYPPLSRATYRYEEALKSWDGNEKARQGLKNVKLVHANVAYDKGDYDFGLSLLEPENAAHSELIEKLKAAIELRDSHAARVAFLRKAALAMLAFIVVFGSISLYVINSAREEAVAAREKEEKAKNEAVSAQIEEEKAKNRAVAAKLEEEKAKDVAVFARQQAEAAQMKEKQAKDDAVAAKLEEEKAKNIAVAAKQQAEEQRARAEYEEYISKIALAKARLERNEADGAREILLDLKSNPNSLARTQGWEWRWLWRQANQSNALFDGESPLIDLAVAKDGTMCAIAAADGKVQLLRLGDQNIPVGRFTLPSDLLGDQLATSVALDSSGQQLAVGTSDGEVIVASGFDDLASLPETVVVPNAHKRKVTDLCFGGDGTLWTASEDRTVKSWKQSENGSLVEVSVGWHFLPVQQISIANQGQKTSLAAVVGNGRTGKIVVWEQTQGPEGPVLNLVGRMSDHPVPPTAVAFDSTGQRVASGDLAGEVFVWNASEVSEAGEEKYLKSIESAVRQAQNSDENGSTNPSSPAAAVGVPLRDTELDTNRRNGSAYPSGEFALVTAKAHSDAIESIRFSDDGKSLLTASDDYTVKLWDLKTEKVRQTLKGHGGWVVGAEFLAGQDDFVISASDDTTVRLWNPNTYVGAFKSQQTANASDSSLRTTLETSDPREEIWSASFAPSGKQIVIARGDHKAEVIRIDEDSLAFRQVSELSLDEGTDFVAMSMHVDKPHGLLYIGSADQTIRIWDLELGVQVGAANETGLNTAFALSNDGRWLLTGASDPAIRGVLWKLDPTGKTSPQKVHSLLGIPGQGAVTCFAISPDSKILFTGDDFGIGMLWDSATGKLIGGPMLNLRGSRINDAVFREDGKHLFIAADNAAITEIDLQTRQEERRFQQLGYVVELSLSEDENHLLSVCELANETYVKTFATLWDVKAGLGTVLDLTVTPRQNELESVSRARITAARFDPNGKMVVSSRTANEKDKSEFRVWDLAKLLKTRDFISSEQMNQMVMLSDQSINAGTVFVMPAVRGDTEDVVPLGSERLLTMNNNGAFLWNLKTKREEKSYRAHAELTEADFSFDGRYVATASRSVKIWDAVTGKALAKYESGKPIRTVQFSPVRAGTSGYVFATAGDQGLVQFWEFDPKKQEIKPFTDVADENSVKQAADGLRPIKRIRFSNDGDRLLVVGDQGLARFRHLRDASKTITLSVPEEQGLRCATISDDGAYIAAGSSAKNVLVWQLPEAGRELKLVTLSGHAGAVNDIGLIGNDSETLRVFSASQDGTTRAWDPRFASSDASGDDGRGREIISLRRHQGDVTSLDTTNGGDLLMTAGGDGTVILWPADPANEKDAG